MGEGPAEAKAFTRVFTAESGLFPPLKKEPKKLGLSPIKSSNTDIPTGNQHLPQTRAATKRRAKPHFQVSTDIQSNSKASFLFTVHWSKDKRCCFDIYVLESWLRVWQLQQENVGLFSELLNSSLCRSWRQKESPPKRASLGGLVVRWPLVVTHSFSLMRSKMETDGAREQKQSRKKIAWKRQDSWNPESICVKWAQRIRSDPLDSALLSAIRSTSTKSQ